jgi:hypothetical protein
MNLKNALLLIFVAGGSTTFLFCSHLFTGLCSSCAETFLLIIYLPIQYIEIENT